VELLAVDLHLRLHPASGQVLRARVHIGHPPEPALHAPAGSLDHLRVESGACHDREVLAIDGARVEFAARAMQAHHDRSGEVMRDVQVRGKQIRGAGRQDRERGIGPGDGVDAALHHPVATPDENEIGSFCHCAARVLRRPPAFVDLVPERLANPLAREYLAQFAQATAHSLTRVRHHCDRRHCSLSCRRRPRSGRR